jgi:UTP--glucose-1-phosphate uridylyltransferase
VGPDLLPHLGAIAGEPVPDDHRVIRVTEFKEKPNLDYAQRHLRVPGLAPDEYYCHFGIHAFTPRIFDKLEYLIRRNIRERNEFQLTAAQDLLAREEEYYAYEIVGERYDIGLPQEYVRTIRLMARPA